ncbi:hypothetical protein DFH27DRAFT_608628 [Peziza echinospora]|nr:hypothetical protein DFH27DRAFT_608628 [Peziza echinospora]
MATKLSNNTLTQFAMLIVDSKGRVTIETSEAFRAYRDNWFPEELIKNATDSTLALVNEMKARRRSDMEQNGGRPDPRVDEAAVMEDEDEFEDDAEHEDEDGIHRHHDHDHESSGFPKHLFGFPELQQSPPSLYGSILPYGRKRSLQTAKPTMGKKRRRSSVRSLPLQRSDSTSGESSTMHQQSTQTWKPLMIADAEAVTTFFETRFRQLQQLTCKVVAKAWIKVIEPKKQSNFPYNRGEESKPAWWPNGARHKEPDHLMKPERLLLLMTMLRCRKVPISKLENATTEVSAHIEESRIGLLSEIYRVAKMEERYLDGVLPENSVVYVAPSADKILANPKAHSPKPSVDISDTPPTVTAGASSLGSSMMATSGGNEAPRNNGPDLQSRHTPRSNPGDMDIPSRVQHQQFAISRTQSNIQSVHTSMAYSSPSLYGSAPGSGDDYLDSPHHPPTNYYYQRSSISYGPPTPVQPVARRAQSVSSQHPSHSQYWPLPQQSTLYYTPSSQPQHPHHSGHGSHSLGILPPPTRTQNSHHQHSQLGSHHSHEMAAAVADDRTSQYDSSRMAPQHMHQSVTFSEMLEDSMGRGPYALGSVPGSVGDDIVGLGSGRNPDGSVGILNPKEMPHP